MTPSLPKTIALLSYYAQAVPVRRVRSFGATNFQILTRIR